MPNPSITIFTMYHVYLFPIVSQILPSSIISSAISARIISCRISFRCRFPQPRTENRLGVKNCLRIFLDQVCFFISFLIPFAFYLQHTRTCHVAWCFPHFGMFTFHFAQYLLHFGMLTFNFARYLLYFRHFNLSFCIVFATCWVSGFI
jgi:hypothetical protein